MIPYGTRLKYAVRTFFSLIDFGEVPADIAAAIMPPREPAAPAAQPPAAADTADRAVQMLALLQRDGRLIDFLMEDLAAYPDAQVGAAVRDVHAGCRAALTRYASLAPVIDDAEGTAVSVDGGTDPASVKVVGNVAGEPPYRGVLRHRGWDVVRIDLPPLPVSGRTIVAPAEVEIT